jgi:hypothetical protein
MCLPSPKMVVPPPPPTPRWLQDTSGEMIKSKYPLSARNAQKNKSLLSRKQKPTVATATSNDNGGGDGGGGTPINQGTTLQKEDLMKNDAGMNYSSFV